jgi:acyl-CoA synthetase (NDP forming)
MADDTHDRAADSLSRLFRPRHVAVFGASRAPGKPGHTVMRNLVRGGFNGRVSAINTVGVEVEGRPGYRSLGRLPARPDCVFLALPPPELEEAIRESVEAGVRFAIVGTSLTEAPSAESAERHARVLEIARSGGLRLLGPRSSGVMDIPARVSLGFNAAHADSFESGSISIISQSGGLFDGVARRLRHLGAGLSKLVAVGDEVDLNVLDFLEFLVDDEPTEVIGLAVDGLSGADRFRRLAQRAQRAGKFIIVLKVGRAAGGFTALLRESGVAGVSTVEALAGGCALVAADEGGRAPTTRGLTALTTSGAGAVILADAAATRDLPLRDLVDLGTLGDWNLLPQMMNELDHKGPPGPVVAYAHVPPGPGMAEQLASALTRRRQAFALPVVVLAPGGLSEPVEAIYARSNIPLFRDTAACFDSLQCYWTSLNAAQEDYPPPASGEQPVPATLAQALKAALARAGSGAPVVENAAPENAAPENAAADATPPPTGCRVIAQIRSEAALGRFLVFGPDVPQALREATQYWLPLPCWSAALASRVRASALGDWLASRCAGADGTRAVDQTAALLAGLLAFEADCSESIESIEIEAVVGCPGEVVVGCPGEAAVVRATVRLRN